MTTIPSAVMARPAVRTLRLPDGIDTTRLEVRARIEARVAQINIAEVGTWVPMFPRHRDVVDGVDLDLPLVNARPGEVEVALGPAVKPTDALKVAAKAVDRGLAMVEFDPYVGYAVFAAIDRTTLGIRNRLAAMLRCQPHEVEVATYSVPDPKTGVVRLDQVVVLRAPVVGVQAGKRIATWNELVLTLPGGSAGWEVLDDPVTGQVRLRYGTPRRLPDIVPLAEILPDMMRPQDWDRLPLGRSPEGAEIGVNLLAGPHSLLVGPTGTGKTVALLALVSSALCRGHRVIMIDPTKAGLDFLRIQPWCSGWADTLERGQATIEAIYAEVQRRKAVLQQYGEVKWSDLSPQAREQHQIYPTLVVIDEYGSLVIQEDIPKALKPDHPIRVEAESRNIARAVIASLVGRIAREARFAGIHLAIALQRPDANIMGGELRSNLTSRGQLAPPGKPLSLDALRMVFDGDVASQAAEVLAELDDGRSLGLATMAAEGGSATGFRCAYAAAAEIPALLERVGVPKPQPWDIGTPSTAADPEWEYVEGAPTPPVAPVVEHDDLVISLDDLDFSIDREEPRL